MKRYKRLKFKYFFMVALILSLTFVSFSQDHDHLEENKSSMNFANDKLEKKEDKHEDEHDNHKDHDHEPKHQENHIRLDTKKEHERDKHDDHDEEKDRKNHAHDKDVNDEESEQQVELSDNAIKLANIQFDTVKIGKIKISLSLAGEVGFDEDHLVHIVPRFSGIVRKVNKRLGDNVKKGDVLAEVESNESLSMYEIISSSDGTIIEKHITLGEHVKDDSRVYVVADLSTVWINLSIYSKDIHNIKNGQKVEISAIGTDLFEEGTISYISPSFNEKSRIAKARVELSNPRLLWRPGIFVKGGIRLESSEKVMLIKKTAIQILNEKTVVFIEEEKNEFIPVPVEIGKHDDKWTEITKGLNVGDKYVSNGAFELKAEIVTGSLSGHAGHGH